MHNRSIVITGANSYLGSSTVRHLLDATTFEIFALVSPRWDGRPLVEGAQRLHHITADLTGPLDSAVRSRIRDAHRVVHFAWSRGKQLGRVQHENMEMVRQLLDAAGSPEKLCFISTVAAGPQAMSIYGKAKYAVMQQLEGQGAIILVCGLVVDREPHGPYRLLTRSVQHLPFSIRFSQEGPPVYPVLISDVTAAIQVICEQDIKGGRYRLFGKPVPLNHFLALLENAYPRTRLPFRIWTRPLLATIAWLKRINLVPSGLADKVLTFLHKEVAFLDSHQELPAFRFKTVAGHLDVNRGKPV